MKIKLYSILAMLVVCSACKKEFLDKPSQNNPTLETYYTNAGQVNAATGLLYNTIWYDYIDKAFHAMEVRAGNMFPNAPIYTPYQLFTVSSTDAQVANSWGAFYKVAGAATVLVKTFEEKKALVSDAAYLTRGIAEARFIRAYAYFNLARAFGDVPIVTDPVGIASSGQFNVPRYKQADVLRFVIEDLKFAEENLGATADAGRVTSLSATGMMAKVYLYLKDYTNAKAKALQVINSGKYSLYPDYGKMFTTAAANNNQESLFALQWLAAGGYSIGNSMQIYIGPATLLRAAGGGFSTVVPSIDLLRAYEPGDLRKAGSIMEQGFKRTDWINSNFPGGFTYDTLKTVANGRNEETQMTTATRSHSLKYIVGPGSATEIVNSGFNSINTYVLRYADILLIYAEATMGGGGSTSDPEALRAFNMVRHRAGFSTSADKTSLDITTILHERRIEFAFEGGDYWYDIQRQGYGLAKVLVAAQERGPYSGSGVHVVDHISANLSSESQLYLPIPANEITTNPELTKPAVPYY
jgi:hypothetical protein